MSEFSSEGIIAPKSAGVITLEWLKEFARVAGDPNPIHQDVTVAKAMGLPGVIAHGMLISGLLHSRAIEVISDFRNLREFRIGASQSRFKAMTFLGDEITISGQWSVVGSNEIKLELQAQDQKKETKVISVFTLIRS